MMNRKLKTIVQLIILMIMLFLFTGCTTRNGKYDIEKYVEEKLKLTDFTVSNTYEKIESYDGYESKLWTVKDEKNDVTFHVLDFYFYSDSRESKSNELRNDYSGSLLLKQAKNIEKEKNIKVNTRVLPKVKTEYNELVLSYKYKDEKELREIYNTLVKIKEYLEEKKLNTLVSYEVLYDIGITKDDEYLNKNGYIFDNYYGEYTSSLSVLSEKNYDEMLLSYHTCLMTYNLDNLYTDVNSSEIQKVLDAKKVTRLSKFEDYGNEKKVYNDIYCTNGAEKISIGALYRLLKEEGFSPDGNSRHFTVNVNGDKYEFSYDFEEPISEEERKKEFCKEKFYYLKNNEKQMVKVDEGESSFFIKFKNIKEIFGLNIGI